MNGLLALLECARQLLDRVHLCSLRNRRDILLGEFYDRQQQLHELNAEIDRREQYARLRELANSLSHAKRAVRGQA